MHKVKERKGLWGLGRLGSPEPKSGIRARYMPRPQESLHLGQRLRAARQARHFQVDQVVESTGIAASSIRAWERGETAPNLLKAAQLATLYGVTLDYLAGIPEPDRDPNEINRPGLIVLDQDCVDGILGSTDPDVIADYCNWPGGGVNMFDLAWRVPESGRIVSYQEVTALVAEVQRHISEHAPKLVRKWMKLMGAR